MNKDATQKCCARCGTEIQCNRKYCSESCKYWYNAIRKEKEAHLPPAKKRNRQFFSMITGYSVAKSSATQGKRSGGMIMGSMSARVNCTNEIWVEVTPENLNRHFTCISFYEPTGIRLGDGSFVKKEDIAAPLDCTPQ